MLVVVFLFQTPPLVHLGQLMKFCEGHSVHLQPHAGATAACMDANFGFFKRGFFLRYMRCRADWICKHLLTCWEMLTSNFDLGRGTIRNGGSGAAAMVCRSLVRYRCGKMGKNQ